MTTQDGRVVTDVKQLVQIVAQAGAQGGFAPYTRQLGDATMTPSNAYGTFGDWRVSLTGYTDSGSGHLASLLTFGGAQVNNNYLYRVQVPGHPELNQIQTTLNMTGSDINNIDNANAIQAHPAGTDAPNMACASVGAIRTSVTGADLAVCSASASVWEPTGVAAVNVTNDMPCNNNGQIATDVTNIDYTCKNNQYVATSNTMGRFVINHQLTSVTDSMASAKDNCPGGTPWVMYTSGTFLVNDTGYVNPPIEGNLFTAIDQDAVQHAQVSAHSSSTWYSRNDAESLGGQLVGTLTTGCQY